MKIRLLVVSRADEPFIKEAVEHYINRIKRYTEFDLVYIKASTSSDPLVNRRLETKAILEKVAKNETLVALDEKGKQFTSEGFAQFLESRQQQNIKTLTFIIGGSYGFEKSLLEASSYKISLSQMTLPHQLARVLFVEQLYRAFTIVKGEKYHHI